VITLKPYSDANREKCTDFYRDEENRYVILPEYRLNDLFDRSSLQVGRGAEKFISTNQKKVSELRTLYRSIELNLEIMFDQILS